MDKQQKQRQLIRAPKISIIWPENIIPGTYETEQNVFTVIENDDNVVTNVGTSGPSLQIWMEGKDSSHINLDSRST